MRKHVLFDLDGTLTDSAPGITRCLGHAVEAVRVLGEALDLAPERATLHRTRARALLALGETELAIAALEDELEVDSPERREPGPAPGCWPERP